MLASAQANAQEVQAGVARVDLTPPLSLKASLGGYGARMGKPATGVHDRVWAKALVVSKSLLACGDSRDCVPRTDASIVEVHSSPNVSRKDAKDAKKTFIKNPLRSLRLCAK
jgi:hypothetical protein